LYAGATGDNIDGAPTFVDAASGDYRLAPGSLGIDAADYNTYLTSFGSSSDLSDATRTVDSCIADTGSGLISYLDIGAYETQDDGPDSDGDGVPDACDVCPGFDDNIDSDGDGVPDGCDTPCGNLQLGDVDGNAVVEFADAAAMSAILLDPASATADQQCAADVNQDGGIDGLDIQAFVNLLLTP
ncbi:MAG: hypothetical protein KDA33_01110, partial [Phycisphaerales bacterium]|nr:hypothetical protein [Phycisphaerales bacterium]